MKILLAAALCATVTAGSASALTQTYVVSVDPTTPSWTRSFTVPLFNPALGTLTDVYQTLSATVQGMVYKQNLTTASYSEQLNLQGGAGLSVNDVYVTGIGPTYAGPITYLAPFHGVRDFTGPDSVFLAGSATQVAEQHLFDPADFIGRGVFLVGLAGSGDRQGLYDLSDTETIYETEVVSATATFTFTYDAPVVTPPPTGSVPEPASWALLVAGFGLTGAMARRRSRGAVAA